MNLTTGHRKASQKGVVLLSAIMTLCILALFAFHPNTYAKAVLSALVFLCVFAMRRLRKPVPPSSATDVAETCIDKDEDGKAEDGKAPTEDIDFVTWMDEAIDSDTLLQVSGNDRPFRHTDFKLDAKKKDKTNSHKDDL